MVGRGRWALAGLLLAAGAAVAQIEDHGKLFEKFPEARKDAAAIIERLAKSHDVQAHVVTLPMLAKDAADKIKAMDQKGRDAFWLQRVNTVFQKLPNRDHAALLLISEYPGRVELHLGKQTGVDTPRQVKVRNDILAVLKADSKNFGGALATFAKDLERNVVEAKQLSVLKPEPGKAAARAAGAGGLTGMQIAALVIGAIVVLMVLRGLFAGAKASQAARQQYPQGGMGGGMAPQRPMAGGYPQQPESVGPAAPRLRGLQLAHPDAARRLARDLAGPGPPRRHGAAADRR